MDRRFLDLGTSHHCCFTSQGKIPRYPLDRKMGGPHRQSGQNRGMKILDYTGTRISNPLVIQPIGNCYANYATAAN
jgi:hypothetical protein